MIPRFQRMHYGQSGPWSARECEAVLAILDSCQALLKWGSGGVAASGICVLWVGLGDVLLGEGRGHVDGDVDWAVDGLGLLAGVDAKGGEAWVFEGEIVFLFEFVEVDFGLLFSV